MIESYAIDRKNMHIYHVYNSMMPSGSAIRTIKYDFGTKGHGIAFVAKDCLDTLGYKYKRKDPDRTIYQYVSPSNIINGNDVQDNESIYIQVDGYYTKPLMITYNGFFELVRNYHSNRKIGKYIDSNHKTNTNMRGTQNISKLERRRTIHQNPTNGIYYKASSMFFLLVTATMLILTIYLHYTS